MNNTSHEKISEQYLVQLLRRTLLFLLLSLLGPTAIYAAEPPEVEKLKGLYIRPAAKGSPSGIPGWQRLQGGLFPVWKTYPELGFKVITRDSLAAFVITKYYPDKSYSIRDARAIPLEHVHRFRVACERETVSEQALIVALAYFEEHCPPETRRIIQAWQIDRRTGEVQDILREGILCHVSSSGDLPCKP